MSYVDEYAQRFRAAADRQAQGRPHPRRPAPRAGLVALAVAAVVAAAIVLPGLPPGERAVSPAPAPPEDPRVSALLDRTSNGDVRREVPCRPPRPGAGVSSEPVAPATRALFGALRRPGNAPPRILRAIRRGGDPRAAVLSRSVRLMPYGAAEPRAVLFVQHGPVGRLFPRDPERCLHLKRAALLEGAAHEPEEVREGALRALEKIAASELETIDDRQDRLFLFALRDGVPAGGGGGGTAAQVGRTGMHSTSILRRDGRVGRDVEGLVPDGVAEVEIVAHGAPPRGWVRRHRLRVRGNYFRLPYFHAESFELRWLDARGREVPHGPP